MCVCVCECVCARARVKDLNYAGEILRLVIKDSCADELRDGLKLVISSDVIPSG